MEWYLFIQPKTQDSFTKENYIVDLLSKLITKYNKGIRKGTLLLYNSPPGLNYTFYYLTSPNKEIIKSFMQIHNAHRCFEPQFISSTEFSETKFLSGDVVLWLNLIRICK